MKIRGKQIPLYKIPGKAAKKAGNMVSDYIMGIKSSSHISKLSKINKRRNEKIVVAFIVQVPEIWDKQESLYIRMIEDSKFDTCLVIVPAYDFLEDKIGEYGLELEFFLCKSLGGKCIKAWENGVWKDIRNLGFDYVFYQRPYDQYLPNLYRSQELGMYTKVCYIPYATPEMRKTTIYPKGFFRNIYFGFMEDESGANINNKKYAHKEHISFYNAGYPVFEKMYGTNDSCKYETVLWTPRWSYSPIVGGSHFFEYNDTLSEFGWIKRSLIIRPHPMMWNHFEKEGLLTVERAEEIRRNWKSRNIEIDNNQDIKETFQKTDILISDRSSVIPMFFLTGKPIIYCPIETDYGSLFSLILPGLYIANTQKELLAILNLLFKKEDPLKDVRKEIIMAHFAQHVNATDSIINIIKLDAMVMEEK